MRSLRGQPDIFTFRLCQRRGSLYLEHMTAAALLPSAPANGSRRVGMSDAGRLERNFVELVHADNETGASIRLETRALAHAQHALDLQAVGQAATRVRQRLYYLAAAFTGT